jgi:hypothetical protein
MLRIFGGRVLGGGVNGIAVIRFVLQQWSKKMPLPPPPFHVIVGDCT